MAVLGMLPEDNVIYNLNLDGTALPQGAPVDRGYAMKNYAFYGQDTRRTTGSLTASTGLRWEYQNAPQCMPLSRECKF